MATILAVDDDADIRAVLKTSLELAGHEAVVAASGKEALAKLKKRAFDLVLLDIMMPEMSGYEVLEAIRAIPSRADTRVVVVTAKHDPPGLNVEVELGVIDHLVKPFMPSELEAVVRRALEGSPEEHQERRRMLAADADLYGSIGDLFEDVRSDNKDR